jgi:subtilase family serine protease
MTKTKTAARLGIVLLGGSLGACSGADPTSTSVTSHELIAARPESAPVLHKAVCSEDVAEGEGRCHARVVVDAKGTPIHFTTPTGFGPSDLVSAYNIPTTGGAGMTVAVIDAFDDPNAESDLAFYRSYYGLPACTSASGCFQKVNQNGAASPLPAADTIGWALEIALDIQMVSTACPLCKIILVEANDQTLPDLTAGVDSAVALGASAVSNSYGFHGATSYQGYEKHYNHPGVMITASSGDYGYGAYYPAESRWTTTVGGTSLTKDTSARGWSETAWSSGGSACSTFAPKPPWQTDTGCTYRTEADISAVGDPNTGVAVYETYEYGGWVEVGGTSVSSPMVAALFAAAGKANVLPSFSYKHLKDFNDVTSGTNGSCSPSYLCTAGAGYDGPTGNGTPNGVKIQKAAD